MGLQHPETETLARLHPKIHRGRSHAVNNDAQKSKQIIDWCWQRVGTLSSTPDGTALESVLIVELHR